LRKKKMRRSLTGVKKKKIEKFMREEHIPTTGKKLLD